MDYSSFEVPISLHIFNRPETTEILFNKIRKIRPTKLFITADGPRLGNLSDQKNCELTRLAVSNVDWDCQLYTNFSDVNKGSFKSTSEGITWVFEHVDRAIILEDDCIPNSSFFSFCQELLDYYENDTRVALISGFDIETPSQKKYSYYFSRYTHMWGWATWKRTWENVDFEMNYWPEYRDNKGLDLIFSYKHEVMYWTEIMQNMFDKRTEAGLHWDYLLLLSMFMNNSVAIRPSSNLISNNGYGEDATHFKGKTILHDVENKEMNFPLVHQPYICRDVLAEAFSERYVFSGGFTRYMFTRSLRLLPRSVKNVIRRLMSLNVKQKL